MRKEQKEKIANCLKEARDIRDGLTGNAREFADAVVGALEALESDKEEHTIEEVFAELDRLKETVNRSEEEAREEVANRIQKLENKIAGMAQNVDKKNALTKKVANELAKAILGASGKEAIADSVSKVLKRNSIEGFTAAEIVDWAVELKIEDLNPLWRQLHKTTYNTWYYNAEDFKAAYNTIAHQHNEHGTAKDAQVLSVTKKQIATDYVYKMQQIAFKDLDDIEEAGGLQEFLQMISNELYQMIVDTIVQYILTGETMNAGMSSEIATFESVVAASSEFVTTITGNDANLTAFLTTLGYGTSDMSALLTANANAILAAIRYTSDQVWNPRSKHKVALMSGTMLTKISAYRYSENGDLLFRSKEDVAAQIGVDEIITSDLMGDNVTVMLPDGYWVKEVKSIDVAYPVYEKNVRNFQKEINAGGAFHDILCCATFSPVVL